MKFRIGNHWNTRETKNHIWNKEWMDLRLFGTSCNAQKEEIRFSLENYEGKDVEVRLTLRELKRMVRNLENRIAESKPLKMETTSEKESYGKMSYGNYSFEFSKGDNDEVHATLKNRAGEKLESGFYRTTDHYAAFRTALYNQAGNGDKSLCFDKIKNEVRGE